MRLRLGAYHFDVEERCLVMGILNRTPDSFFDKGAYFDLDDCLARADRLVAEGADIIDIGGVKAGPGPAVTTAEELDRVVPVVESVADRFDVAVSVDTWSAPVAKAAFEAGAVLGNDISGFADPDYLDVAAAAGAGVVATHIRLAPRVADPDPRYNDLQGEVESFLDQRVQRALAAGVGPESIVVDAGLDLGKRPEHSLELLRATDRLVANMGRPVLLSASNKTFLGWACGGEVTERREASLAAAALGVWKGARIVRTHDVAGTRRVCATVLAVATAR